MLLSQRISKSYYKTLKTSVINNNRAVITLTNNMSFSFDNYNKKKYLTIQPW